MKKSLTLLSLLALIACQSQASLSKQQEAYFDDAWFTYIENHYNIGIVQEVISDLSVTDQKVILNKMILSEQDPQRKANLQLALDQLN